MGSRAMVVSSLAIADADEGFDLDLDGKIDNKLSPLGSLANDTIKMSFTQKHDIILPIELFGYEGSDNTLHQVRVLRRPVQQGPRRRRQGHAVDAGLGRLRRHRRRRINPGATEDLTNRVDDDCDGYADNATTGSKPTDTQDLDGDGYSLAQGDCDDRADADHIAMAKLRHPGAMDICDDGIDQDCDGIPDNDPSCDPFKSNDVTVDVQRCRSTRR